MLYYKVLSSANVSGKLMATCIKHYIDERAMNVDVW